MPSLLHTVSFVPNDAVRLDRYIAENMCLFSRSQIKARRLKALVNGKAAKISLPVKNGDVLELSWNEDPPADLIPQDIPLDIIYEDERSVVINKAQGMVVHPAAGNWQGTLANALYHRRLQRGVHSGSDGLRPGIVHRLDKDTSGVMIAAYDEESLAFLAGQFKAGQARKKYVAIVSGIVPAGKGRIETFIARDPKNRKLFAVANQGRRAITFYTVIKTWKKHSLLVLRPKTGRTHQIRVHLRHIGHPVLGDPFYGFLDPLFPKATLMLHARSLAIALPGMEGQRLFKTPMPQRFVEIMHKLDSM